MNLSEYNAFCASFPHTTTVIQWGGAHVWKVAGKVFAIAWDDPDYLQVTFKTSDIAFAVLSDEAGTRPAPYMASRGMKWIQDFEPPGLGSDENLKEHIAASYRLVSLGLTKKKQKELGLNQS